MARCNQPFETTGLTALMSTHFSSKLMPWVWWSNLPRELLRSGTVIHWRQHFVNNLPWKNAILI